MQLTDIPYVMAIERRAFPLAWTSGIYRRELTANPWSHYLVLHSLTPDQPAILSYGGVWQMDHAGHISTIATHPDCVGRKLGSYVLIHLLLRAYEVNCTEATLEVRVTNTVAQALYAHYGFEVVGRRRRYYANNHEDALIMTRSTLDPNALLEELVTTEAAVCAHWFTATTPHPTLKSAEHEPSLLPPRGAI
jgi:ribosomal-protein-alanine N-acetyltransferase